jgi:integrase
MQKLTQKTVDALALPAGKSEHITWLPNFSGLGFRIRETGAKGFIYQYKIGQQQRRITLRTDRLDQALKLASELRAKVALGLDPAGEKFEQRARAAETMGNILPAYLAYHRGICKPGSRSHGEVERHLDRHAKPLHGLLLSKIDRRSIATLLVEIAAGGGDVVSNHVRKSLSAFFSWCIAQGLIDQNPVVGTVRRPETSRDRVLSPTELKVIWAALEDDDYGAILKLLLLTGQRANEIAALCWSEIADGQIVLPGARTKNGREHIIPLPLAAQAILDRRIRSEDRDYVFGRRQGPFSGWSKSKQQLDARIKEATGKALPHFTPHDLRRTCATRLGELGVLPHVIEAMLNHVSGHKAGVAGVYNKSTYEREKAAALALWADHIVGLVEGRSAKVVSLPRTR